MSERREYNVPASLYIFKFTRTLGVEHCMKIREMEEFRAFDTDRRGMPRHAIRSQC